MSDPAATDAVSRISRLCDLGRWQEASREAALYLQSRPDDARALCLLAQARLGLQDPGGALTAAQSAMTAEPGREWPLRLASLASQQLGRPAEAVQFARGAVEVAPFVAQSHVRLAGAEAALGRDLDSARRAAEEALRLAPHLLEAHLAAGGVAYAQKRFADAEAAYREALRIDPQSATAHNDLARAMLRRRRFLGSSGLAAAAGGFATALRADPTAQVSRRNLDLIMHVFLRRLSYFVFLAAYVGIRLATTATVSRWALWLPVAALVVPAAFAVRFALQLTGPLRSHLRQSLRGPRHGLPAVALVLAAGLLGLGGAAPRTEQVAFGLALALALGARIALYVHGRRTGYTPRKRRPPPR